MTITILSIALAVALILLGATVVRSSVYSKSKGQEEANLSTLTDNLLRGILDRQRAEAETQRRNYEETSARILAETRRQYETQISRLEERLRLQADELRSASAIQFEALSAAALERQTDRLAEESRHELQTLLNPLRENLGDFKKAINDSYMEENASREALTRQITSLINANHEIGTETRRLADALHGNTRMQGIWGEEMLESLFQKAGFIRHTHYVIQSSKDEAGAITTDEGRLLRPDLIFFLPDSRKIVIDAKTSMTAYLDYCEASSGEEEQAALRRHAESVRRHIDELGRAGYHKNINGALEHTLMFMPNDGAFLAALRGDRKIAEYAMQHNVVITAPSHLISVISLVAQLWRIDRQNKNVEEIARLGGNLYDKMAAFLNDFETLDRNIENLRKAYEKSKSHLKGSSTSIAARAERLRQLGAKTSKNIPPSYLE